MLSPLPLGVNASDNGFKAINRVLHVLTLASGPGAANQGQKCWSRLRPRVNPHGHCTISPGALMSVGIGVTILEIRLETVKLGGG